MEYRGLKSSEVEKMRQKFGSNKLPEPPVKKWYQFAKEALSDHINLVLIAIAVVQLLLAISGFMEFTDPVMIMVVLGVVVAIAVKTGLGIQKSNRELKAKTSTRYCQVFRDNQWMTLDKNDLVVGDLVMLETGQDLYADGYIIDGKVAVNNAAINGETKECRKTPVEGYKPGKTLTSEDYTNQNCLFAGTSIVSGEGKMQVTAVGINTVNGDTLVKMQTLEAPKTALDIALDNLAAFISKWGTIAAVIAFVVISVCGIAQLGFSEYMGSNIPEMINRIATNISVALTIIVAAVPEGLPLIVQLVTKQNVSTMEKNNILARNAGKIPELANVDLICTDKTGTLTTGIMKPVMMINGNGDKVDVDLSVKENIILNNSALYNSAGVITGGNSIDRALLSWTTKEEFKEIKAKSIELAKVPFNSEYKFSSYSVGTEDGICQYTLYKGAPEKIMEQCTLYVDANGNYQPLNHQKVSDAIKEMTTKSMRCIALATHEKVQTDENLPTNMVLQGVIGVMDPVREEVPDAVAAAHKAGIQVIMITGDCIETAVAIAKECGIYTGNPQEITLTDKEFSVMSDDDVKEIIPRLRVIARCAPNTKLRLVTLAQELGRSVSVTGDGTNDSPALKKADVGFAMYCGTDVAKEACDIILTDNNFASVVKAVELGRTFMHNILMFLEFQLPINISLLILNILYPIFWIGSILTSVQILIVNIIMDSLNSLSFGGEPPKAEYMVEAPIKKGSGLFIRDSKTRIAVSTVTFIAVYAALLVTPLNTLFKTPEAALAARFALLCIMAVMNGFTVRTDKRNLLSGLRKNKLFVKIAAGIMIGAVLIVQFGGSLIHTTALTFVQWAVVFALSLAVIPVDFIRKTIMRKRG